MPKYAKDSQSIYISPRMQELLSAIQEHVLTDVVAPMGYGKSTAALWFLAERKKAGDAVFRVSIYAPDPALFWQHFCHAFRGTELGERLCGMDFPTGRNAVHMLMENMTDYLQSLAGDLYLLIDDCHLMEDRRIFDMLFALCDLPTDKLHMILLSRSTIFTGGEELHLGSRLHRITSDDLRLRRQELDHYLSRCGFALPERDFETLYRRSEGWFSCVYLHLRSYEKTGALLSPGEDIYDMIGKTLFSGYTGDEQQFLVQLSLADEFTVEQAAAITGRTDAPALLRSFVASNAFIRYMADTDTYRFHHMLKDYAERIYRRLPEEEQRELCLRHGRWHEERGQYHQAILFYGQAEDRRAALRVIGLDRATQLTAIAPDWTMALIDNCSTEELLAEPQALLVLMRRLFSWQQIPRMLALKALVLQAAENPGITEEERNNLLGDCDLMMSFLGYNDIAAMSRLHRSACERMTRPSISIQKNGSWTFGSPSVLMMFHREAGALDKEIAVMNDSMPYYYRVADNQGMGAEKIMEAEARFCRGQLVEAHVLLEKARAAAAAEEQHFILVCCDFLALRMALFGCLEMPADWYETRLARYKLLHDPLLFTVLDGCAAWYGALSGQTELIPGWLREGKLAEARLLGPARPMYEVIYNQVLLGQGEYARVLGREEDLLQGCRRTPYMLCEIHVHIQCAAANLAMGRTAQARDSLAAAFELALPDGILLPFAENEPLLRPLLARMPAKYARAIEQIRQIGSRRTEKKAAENALWDTLTEREQTVASLYAAGKTRREIADALYLSEGTVRNYISSIYDKLALEGTPKQKYMALTAIYAAAGHKI